MRWALQRWFLNHESRASWIAIEFLRPLSVRRKFANAWWQLRHFGDLDAFDALWQTHRHSYTESTLEEES